MQPMRLAGSSLRALLLLLLLPLPDCHAHAPHKLLEQRQPQLVGSTPLPTLPIPWRLRRSMRHCVRGRCRTRLWAEHTVLGSAACWLCRPGMLCCAMRRRCCCCCGCCGPRPLCLVAPGAMRDAAGVHTEHVAMRDAAGVHAEHVAMRDAAGVHTEHVAMRDAAGVHTEHVAMRDAAGVHTEHVAMHDAAGVHTEQIFTQEETWLGLVASSTDVAVAVNAQRGRFRAGSIEGAQLATSIVDVAVAVNAQ